MPVAANILIVEDESIIALDLRQILSACGHQVVGSVASAEEAIVSAGALRPDLILMDIRLGGAMTGLEAALAIRQQYAIPCLFITAFVDQEMLRQAKESAALGYVLKPFNERDLTVTIEMALHRAAYERDLQQTLQRENQTPADLLTIHTLGTLRISCGERALETSHLSRSQRQLLALILSSPQQEVSREEVELTLWPDSTPERARSSFDSLLLRLRRNLNEVLCLSKEKDFLCFRRGILTLEHCRVDVCDFQRHVRQGIEAFKRGEPATAEAQHTLALNYWQGEFMPGVPGGERTECFRIELREQLHHCCRQLGALLSRSGRSEEGIAVLRKALAADPANDLLVSEIYRLLMSSKNIVQARQLLRQYEESLRKDGFSTVEIREALREISDVVGNAGP